MIKAVIFDMDGTILDTITDITTASNNALEAMGLPHYFTRDEVKLCFGSGIHGLQANPGDQLVQPCQPLTLSGVTFDVF